MSTFRARKVVAVLPAQLEANTVYAVRIGEGFDLYVSDTTGATAHRLNLPETGITSSTVTQIVEISQAAYDALASPDAGTLYLVTS